MIPATILMMTRNTMMPAPTYVYIITLSDGDELYLNVMFELFTCTYIIPKYNTALKDGKETHTFWSNHLVLQFVFFISFRMLYSC